MSRMPRTAGRGRRCCTQPGCRGHGSRGPAADGRRIREERMKRPRRPLRAQRAGRAAEVRPSSARNLDLRVNHEFAGICSCAVAPSNIIMFRMTVFTFSLKFLLSFTQIISHIPDPDNGNKEGRELLLIKMIYAPF